MNLLSPVAVAAEPAMLPRPATFRSAIASHQRVFAPAILGRARLFYDRGVPIAVFEGSPAEIGRQHAALLGPATARLAEYPRQFVAAAGADMLWPLAVNAGRTLMLRTPPRYQQELAALENAPELSPKMREVIPVANTLLELRRLGCSAIALEDDATAGDGPLVGRNFDFESLGILNQYSLLSIVRPDGRHAFASVGFPLLGGVISGMNDQGLAVATLDVEQSADKSRKFDPRGVPLAFVFRQILEDCATIDDAERLLRATPATTWMNLIVCDKNDAAVFEITPATIARRDAVDGVARCTNHFRAAELTVDERCWRYDCLARAANDGRWDVPRVLSLMDEVCQGDATLQTMVFAPRSVQLHLSLSTIPSSRGPLTRIDLAPLLARRAPHSGR